MFLVRSVDNSNHLVHTSRDLEQFYHSMPTHPMPCYAHIPICAPSFQHTYIALNDFVSTLPTCRLAEIYSISVARATICCTTGSVLLPQLQFKSLAVIFSISFSTICCGNSVIFHSASRIGTMTPAHTIHSFTQQLILIDLF